MAGGLSKRPLPLKVDADHESVHKVLSNDDLLKEILVRSPMLSLHLFKRVCKQWLSLITSPRFTLTRTRIPTLDPPSGIFIGQWNSDNYDYVSFDPRIPAKRSINSLACFGRIDQSCNGLLLCDIGGDKYVCNPSSSKFKMLPPIHDLNYERNSDMYMAFDPTKSPCYKVVHVGSVEDDDDDETGYFMRIQTYSSETGVWSVSDDRFPDDLFIYFRDGIYWNDAIHWLDFDEPFLLKLNIVDHPPVLTKIQILLPLTVIGHVHCDRKLFKSDHGSLLLVCKDYDCSQNFNIYEMKNEYYEWSVKYSVVNLCVVMRPNPTWRMPNDLGCRDMVSIVLGERDEDSFMVIEQNGMILQYKFMLETLSELFDSGKADSRSECFQYIASFARV